MAGVIILSVLPTLLIIGWYGRSASAVSASQGPRTATASGDCTQDGASWTSPGNAFSDNATYASASVDGTSTTNLKCANFGFSIPTGVTISGIEMSVKRKSDSTGNGGSQDSAVRLIKGGVIGTTDRSSTTIYTTADVAESHGSSSDLWGDTWTPSDINASNFGAAFAATKLSAAGAAHTITVDVITLTVTYSFTPVFTQAAYQWYVNQDGSAPIGVGAALNGVAQDTATTAPAEQTIFRLRLLLHVSTDPAVAGNFPMKLQFATRGSDNLCDTSFSNETYDDVNASTVIAYGDNATATDGMSIATSANPTHSGHTRVLQEYNEANNTNVTTNVAAGEDGVWDFALKDNGAPASTTYCFRMVYSSGTTLNTYSVIPQITTSSPDFSQEDYRWYEGQGAVPNNTFAQTVDAAGSDRGRSIVQTSDGGYAIAGSTSSYGEGGLDAFLAKYSSTGTLMWFRTLGATTDEEALALVQTTDGGYAIAGTTMDSTLSSKEVFVAKYTSGGDLSWRNLVGGAAEDHVSSIVQGADGALAITGHTASYGSGGYDMFLAKFAVNSGSLSWFKTWGGAGGDIGYDLVTTTDGGYAITGRTTTYGAGNDDAFLAKYDTGGNLMWSKTWGGTSSDTGNQLVATTDGGYAITGETFSYGQGDSDRFLLKYDSSGNLSWNRVWGETDTDTSTTVLQTQDDGYVILGTGFEAGPGSLILVKYDSNGSIQSSRSISGSLQSPDATVTSDGGYAVTGEDTSNDIYFAKYDTDGTYVGCPATTCQDVSGTDISPLASTSSPSAATSSISAGSPQDQFSENTPSVTMIVLGGHMTFARTWGSAGSEYSRSVVQTSDGGYAVTGDTSSSGSTDMYIAKYDASGAQSWSKTWGGNTSNEIGSAIIQTSDGGYAVTGYTNIFGGAGNNDAFLAKYDASGALSWSKTWGTANNEDGRTLVQTADGGYAITGGMSVGPAGNNDMILLKYDSSGALSWSRSWGGTSNDYGIDLALASDGGYIITGNTQSYGAGSNDAFLVKYDSSGTLSWSKVWGGSLSDNGQSVIQTTDGGFVIAGYTSSFGYFGSMDAFFAKYDASGKHTWSRIWGDSSSDQAFGVVQTNDGGYAITGYTGSYGTAGEMYLAKYDATGTISWSRTWGGATNNEQSTALVQTSDGGYAVTGYTNSMGEGLTDMFLLKYDSSGSIAGCTSPMCQSPAATNGTASPTDGAPSVTGNTPSGTANSPSITTTTPSLTHTYRATKALWGVAGVVPGIPLGALNAAGVSVRHDDPLSLRMLLKPSGKVAQPAGSSLKLQVAPRVGTCDTSFTGENYIDVGASAAMNYYDNPNAIGGVLAYRGVNDPSASSGELYYGNYVESSGFSNRRSLAPGQNELVNVSLSPTDNAVYGNYCFRVVKSDNSLFGSYARVIELTVPPAASQQMRHGKFFDEQGGTGQNPLYW